MNPYTKFFNFIKTILMVILSVFIAVFFIVTNIVWWIFGVFISVAIINFVFSYLGIHIF